MTADRDKVKQYWDERARESRDTPAATTSDVHLRRLEIATLVRTLQAFAVPAEARLLDLGCGDGYSTIEVARAMPEGHRFLGLDYSENMIASAQRRLALCPDLGRRLVFRVGDVMQLEQACGPDVYDVVMTDRCLINLDSPESQAGAFEQIAARVRPRGFFVAIENFIEGHENMNGIRRVMGLPEIPVRWHNLYFREAEFVASAGRFFEIVEFKDFSSTYYFVTRVVYSKMCQMRHEEPDYNHEIHQLAVDLPWIGQYSPIRMAVMRRKA